VTKAEQRAVRYVKRRPMCTARDYATHVYGHPEAQLAAGALLSRLEREGLIAKKWLCDAWHYIPAVEK
jgi:hypothetical protein